MAREALVNAFNKAIVLVLSLFFIACSEPGAEHFTLSGSTMGTTYHLTVVERQGIVTQQQELQQAIDQLLLQINQQMSTYMQASELMQLNQQPINEWMTVSNDLFEVLMLSLEISWLSNGAFDITVGPLVDLWGFGPGGNDLPDAIPSEGNIARAKGLVDFQAIEFDLKNNGIRRTKNLRIDLSAIAKGFAADKVAALLDYAGYRDYMVEIGGELRLQGNSPRGTPWRIAIETPEADSIGQVHQALSLSGVGMATSGDYRNFFERNGKRYSHTINPLTGRPIHHQLASVTVIADSSGYADALATAINVMGPEQGMKLAEAQGLAVYMIVKEGDAFKSEHSLAFGQYLAEE